MCCLVLCLLERWHGGPKTRKALGADVHRVYLVCGVWTLFLWPLYPVCWGLCEGGNVIPLDSEAVFYRVLDFCAKPVFSIMLLVGHWNINPARLGLHIRDISEPVAPETERRHGGRDGEQTAASTGVDRT